MDFKIIDGNVYFKEGDMFDYSHFGPEYISEPTEIENRFEVKKFDLQTTVYQHTDELMGWQGHEVVDGYFTVEPEPEPLPEPTNQELIQAALLLNQQEIMIKQAEQDEVLALLLLGQQGV